MKRSAVASLTISGHAADRWRERVDRTPNWEAAQAAILDFCAGGTTRRRPRRWTRSALAPGDRYVYNARRPLVCLVISERTVITVLTPKEMP